MKIPSISFSIVFSSIFLCTQLVGAEKMTEIKGNRNDSPQMQALYTAQQALQTLMSKYTSGELPLPQSINMAKYDKTVAISGNVEHRPAELSNVLSAIAQVKTDSDFSASHPTITLTIGSTAHLGLCSDSKHFLCTYRESPPEAHESKSKK
jgi:hypothetical protein